jgi:polar amino acid transport system permease protein
MWDMSYAIEIFPKLLSALRITIAATFVGFALASVLGLVWAVARRSEIKLISRTVGLLVDFIRTTPLLAQLYFIFYVFPQFGLTLNAFASGVLGLGLHYSTYLSEVYRSGIDGIPKGQWEAARALNFSTVRTWSKIILPQAVPPILPVMGGYLIGMFKQTPLLSAITVVELLQTAQIIGSDTFRYLEPITMVGFLFLVLSYTSSLGVDWLDSKVNKHFS